MKYAADFLDPLQSDHAPSLFRMPDLVHRSPKPFKFFHHIIDHPEYEESVKNAWNCEVIEGSFQFKLVRSLKLLKGVLEQKTLQWHLAESKRAVPKSRRAYQTLKLLRGSIVKEQSGNLLLQLRKSSSVRNPGFSGFIWGTGILRFFTERQCSVRTVTTFTFLELRMIGS